MAVATTNGSGAVATNKGDTANVSFADGSDTSNAFHDEVMDSTQRFKVASSTYTNMSAAGRSAKLHDGPLTLRAAKKPPDRTKWIREDKKNNPYSYFETPGNIATEVPPRPAPPPKLWLPKLSEELRRAAKTTVAKKDEPDEAANSPGGASSSTALVKTTGAEAAKPPWDTEHHIMVSKANSEVQVFCREYFDKPMRKEGEGIPKVFETYAMNDRQTRWHDIPDALGESRRTYLHWVGPYNVGGPKCQQAPSYWRKVVGKSNSSPVLERPGPATFGGVSKNPVDQNILERLAQMPAKESSEYWRGWVKNAQSKQRGQSEEHPKHRQGQAHAHGVGKQEQADLHYFHKSMDNYNTVLKLEPENEEAKNGLDFVLRKIKESCQSGVDKDSSEAHKVHKVRWDNRWSITHSKDNDHNPKSMHEYFTSNQFLSGAEMGKPEQLLQSAGMKWRKLSATARSPELRKLKVTADIYGQSTLAEEKWRRSSDKGVSQTFAAAALTR